MARPVSSGRDVGLPRGRCRRERPWLMSCRPSSDLQLWLPGWLTSQGLGLARPLPPPLTCHGLSLRWLSCLRAAHGPVSSTDGPRLSRNQGLTLKLVSCFLSLKLAWLIPPHVSGGGLWVWVASAVREKVGQILGTYLNY